MQTARVFTNGNSQAVRLPKEFRLDEDEVVIRKIGDMIVLLPTKYRAESLLAMLEEIGPMDIGREQPTTSNDWNGFCRNSKCSLSAGTQPVLTAISVPPCGPRARP